MANQDPVNALETYIWLIGEALWKQAEQYERNAVVRDKRLRRMIMTAVQIEQEDLDAVGTKIEAVVTAIDAIDVTSLPAGTFDAVNSALTDLTSHVNAKLPVPPVTPPVVTSPVDTPPVTDPTDPTDPTADPTA